jgi:hypothetical protein
VPRRPAYQPVLFLTDERLWDTDKAEWKTPRSPDEAALIAASQLQQRLASRIRRALRRDGIRVADLADHLGQGRDQLWRKLAGRAPASLVDLCIWAAVAGDDDALPGVAMDLRAAGVEWPTP